METYKLTVNGQAKEVTVDPGTPLLLSLIHILSRETAKLVLLLGSTSIPCRRTPVALTAIPRRIIHNKAMTATAISSTSFAARKARACQR